MTRREQIEKLCEFGPVLTDEMLRRDLVQSLLKKEITREQLTDLHRLDQKNGPIDVFLVAIDKIEQSFKIITLILEENEKLRGALEKIEFCPRSMSDYPISDMQETARQALAPSPLDELLEEEE
jgi:hypothetical protein